MRTTSTIYLEHVGVLDASAGKGSINAMTVYWKCVTTLTKSPNPNFKETTPNTIN